MKVFKEKHDVPKRSAGIVIFMNELISEIDQDTSTPIASEI